MSYPFLSLHTGQTAYACARIRRSIRLFVTIESNESELALEHMQGIDKDPGKVSRGPTSGGLAGESIDSPPHQELARRGEVSLSDEDENIFVQHDADELER